MSACAVLALESGGAMASVALIDAHGRLSHESAASGQSHSSQLLPMAKRLLDRAGLQWHDLKGIVAGIGPGSFTGLRIACSLAQGLALGLEKKVLPISGFEAWAYAWWLKWGAEENKCVSISFDARLGECFAAVIAVEPSASEIRLHWVEEPAVVAQGRSDRIWIHDPSAESLGLEPLPLAAWMARMAVDPRVAQSLSWAAPAELRPLYVREKVAQTIAERHVFADLSWHQMRIEDLELVMAIENQAYPFPWTAGNFKDSINAGYEAWVLHEHARVIGYLVWMKVVDEAHLLNITLAPARQGHGMGSWMMRYFVEQAKTQGLTKLMLEVRPSNPRAIAMYRKFGFEQIGLRKGYYPAGLHQREDAVVMRRSLAEVFA